MRKLNVVVMCIAIVVTTTVHAQAGFIFSEAQNGDLPSSNPTNLGSVGVGLNTVTGTAAGSPNSDFDSFEFHVPVGLEVTDITVSAAERNGNFFNLRFDLFAGTGSTATNLQNVRLAAFSSDIDSFTVTPLLAGTYTIRQNQISSNHTLDYSVTLTASNVTAVPEPSSLALAGFGACAASVRAAFRRRRKIHNEASI